MNTFKKLSLATVMLAAISTPLFAQTPDWQRINSSLKYMEKGEGKKLVIASANIKAGVSLERLSLISGEGNTEKKIFSGLLAGAAQIAGIKGDFASREPIEEHMKQADAEKVAADTLALLMEKLKAAGLDVQGPKVVVEAPTYAAVKGEDKTTRTTESQEGGLFKKGYYYGIYQTPVAGMKFRDLTGVSGAFNLMNTDVYSNAIQAAGTPAAIDVNIGFVNDKSTFSLTGFSINVYGTAKGSTKVAPYYNATLKNFASFSVSSGGKDTTAYWDALKPKLEVLFDDVSKRIVAAYAEE